MAWPGNRIGKCQKPTAIAANAPHDSSSANSAAVTRASRDDTGSRLASYRFERVSKSAVSMFGLKALSRVVTK
jgi:hypothetical protein